MNLYALPRRVVGPVVEPVERTDGHAVVLLVRHLRSAGILDGAVERRVRDHRAHSRVGHIGVAGGHRNLAETRRGLLAAPSGICLDEGGLAIGTARPDAAAVDGVVVARAVVAEALRPRGGRRALVIGRALLHRVATGVARLVIFDLAGSGKQSGREGQEHLVHLHSSFGRSIKSKLMLSIQLDGIPGKPG